MEGTKISADEFTALSMFKTFNPEMGNAHFLSITSMMGDALGLLERHPELRAEAEKTMTALAEKDNPEATPEELQKTVKRGFDLANGQRVAMDLTHQNEKAKLLLRAESLGSGELTPERIVDRRLQNTEKLYALSGAELENALEGEKLFSTNSPYMKKTAEDKKLTKEKVTEKTEVKKAVKQEDMVLGG